MIDSILTYVGHFLSFFPLYGPACRLDDTSEYIEQRGLAYSIHACDDSQIVLRYRTRDS